MIFKVKSKKFTIILMGIIMLLAKSVASDLIDTLTAKTVDGIVHSVFDHACNIQLDRNRLVTLISPKLPNCPSAIKLDIVEEKKGFGWKGLGSRRIVFDHQINEYRYEVLEPTLTEQELETKNELVHLFKMLADVNVTGMEKEEKIKDLERILEQIIVDNDVKFSIKEKDKDSNKSKFNNRY